MKKGVVNLLTPSYNNAGLITHLLDSVLAQTYPFIEMIVIDDGSTDDTKSVIDDYKNKFIKKGYSLTYKYQVNTGLSGTINNGLKFITGEYLLWPDADDWYSTPHTIEKMVEVLGKTDDSVGMVRCGCTYVDEIDGKVKDYTEYPSSQEPQNIFEDALYLKNNFRYTAGAVAIKCKFLDQYIPDRSIFTSRFGGQNIQLYYPYLLYSKCVTIPDHLYTILIRSNSHGRGAAKTYEEIKRRSYDYFQTYEQTILRLVMTEIEKEMCLKYCRTHHFVSAFNLASKHNKVEDIRKTFCELEYLSYNFSSTEKLRLKLSYVPYGNSIYNVWIRIKSKVKNIFSSNH